jgi:hypothetical protein
MHEGFVTFLVVHSLSASFADSVNVQEWHIACELIGSDLGRITGCSD